MIDSTTSPLAVAVVLTWNDTEMTRNCLQSVLRNDYDNFKVILVDNGSVPPRGPELKEEFPEVILVQNPRNEGFSGGANRGIEAALRLGAEFVQVIGNDATLATNVISELVSALQTNQSAGAAGPLLLDPGPENIVQFYTASLDRERTCHVHHHVGDPYDSRTWTTVESEFIPCVAVMFRAEALNEVGLFDESFGTCWEDYDICLRLAAAGWTYLAVGSATTTHIGSSTTGKVSPYIVYHSTRNRLICIGRYAADSWWKHLIYYLRSHWFFVRQYGLRNWACHRAFLKAFKDYILNVHGERNASESHLIPGRSGT